MRKRKIAANAQEHLQPGEELREMAMTQTVAPNISLAQQLKSTVIAVATTDTNLYALMIHAWKPATVTGAERFPLAQTKVSLEDGKILIGDDISLTVLTGAGKDAKRLVEHASGAGSAASPSV
ncbi:MAG: hypothetical protein ACR2G3_05540 [Solirubrobacterales bacterium]